MGSRAALEDELARLAPREPESEQLGAIDGCVGEDLCGGVEERPVTESEVCLESDNQAQCMHTIALLGKHTTMILLSRPLSLTAPVAGTVKFPREVDTRSWNVSDVCALEVAWRVT